MNTLRPAAERGHVATDWLQSAHSFSFGHYHDPDQMGWGPLRVINEDRVAPGQGFGTHGHRDMEILSYVISGALAHRDSMGNGSTLRPGGVQLMSAGTGVRHSEFNPDDVQAAHFLQIWIQPAIANTAPRYQENVVDVAAKQQRLCPIVSPDGREGSLVIGQDAVVSASLLDGPAGVEHALDAGRLGFVQVVKGELQVNGIVLSAGDGLKIVQETTIRLTHADAAEVLLFDMAA